MKQWMIVLFICACIQLQAQVNFVRNGDLEQYTKCPDDWSQISRANYWSIVIDTVGEPDYALEYLNSCAGSNIYAGLPANGAFYQQTHSGNGMAGAHFYYDKPPPSPPSPIPFNYRDYLQGHLYKALTSGKAYCVSFWLNLAEGSGYAHNKIGAYLDNGAINKLALAPGSEITSVIPQVYTNTKIVDTANWVQIEGSFVAKGNETHISIGNFFPNATVDTVVTNYWSSYQQYSYYLIDDVSVVPIDLPADAGKDAWVEQGKQVQIGRVGDTTAKALNCKWYHKGILIDSGAIISVKANAIKYAVDTYVVVQTICGLVKTDTVLVRTVGASIPLLAGDKEGFTIYPNPTHGTITITNTSLRGGGTTVARNEAKQSIKIYDLLGRLVQEQQLIFNHQEATINLNLANGTYILELQDEVGNLQRERIIIMQ